MGGGWGGLKGMDENMTNQKLLIDYVRVYQRQYYSTPYAINFSNINKSS